VCNQADFIRSDPSRLQKVLHGIDNSFGDTAPRTMGRRDDRLSYQLERISIDRNGVRKCAAHINADLDLPLATGRSDFFQFVGFWVRGAH
jgi:hypothetical protein